MLLKRSRAESRDLPLPNMENRRETRIEIDSTLVPLLGSREEDNVCFQYLPVDVSVHGVRIALPHWTVTREMLRQDDLINLHIPFDFHGETFGQGKIRWCSWDKVANAQLCGLMLEKRMPIYYPIYFSIDTGEVDLKNHDFKSINDLLLRIIKDTFFLKRGILIYFKHLIPYFSRITGYPAKDYPMLKKLLLVDIKNNIAKNQEFLEELYKTVSSDGEYYKKIASHLDLEELRQHIESEIFLEVFKLTFETESPLQYLLAIKELEKRLYTNYNAIILLYLHSL